MAPVSTFPPAPTAYATPTYEQRVDLPADYRPISALGVWLMLFLLMCAAMDAVSMVSTWAHLGMLEELRAGVSVPQDAQDLGTARQGLLAVAQFGAYLTTAIVFLTWLWRAYHNLETFSRWTPAHTPGWAIGAWFVPFLNLVRPYQIVRETWWVSGNPELADDVTTGYTPPGNILLGVWWVGYLGMSVFDQISGRMTLAAQTPSDRIAAETLGIAADGVGLVAAMLAATVVGGISSRQLTAARARGLAA
jgi:hypothetical protein